MQKTFLKFVVFELVERIARFRLALRECDEKLHAQAPALNRRLQEEALQMEEQLLSHKTTLNRLFADNGGAAKGVLQSPDPVIMAVYERLKALSALLVQLNVLAIESETMIFLKDALPPDLLKELGEQSVLLAPEGATALPCGALSGLLLDSLSVLQIANPLGWMGLTAQFAKQLTENASSVESLKMDLLKTEAKKPHGASVALIDSLLRHAVNLRLLGPAYYFYAVADAFFQQDDAFSQWVEPALFYGLNHQNLTHKSLVFMHEACERVWGGRDKTAESGLMPFPKETLDQVFSVVEKLLPAKYAFQEKNLERAVQLQERLSQGVLLSSTSMYPLSEVEMNFAQSRQKPDFSIYEPLAMMTEMPHTPREIINAGWLHRIERGPVWLYAILNEERSEGFEKMKDLLDYQAHLLRKSIEVSEVHRVLLCTPN